MVAVVVAAVAVAAVPARAQVQDSRLVVVAGYRHSLARNYS